MGVRLIAGRAGSGKTDWCLSRVCEALASSPAEGPRLVMLVPEQAALQMERALLVRSAARALGRCEVLSFRRLAHRILNETPGPSPTPLTPIGRQMALRHLIAKHRRELREFDKVAERGGFVAALARGIAELLQESVTVEQLQSAAAAAEEEGDPSAARLHDAALLYQAYLDYLGVQRVDPEGVLDLARTRLAATAWLDGATVWVDGFAGLTRQQVRMIVSLGQRVAHMEVALLLEAEHRGTGGPDAAPDDLSLFARTERTWFTLAREFGEAGIPVEEPVFVGKNGCPRFKGADALARLERGLFVCGTGETPKRQDGEKSKSREVGETAQHSALGTRHSAGHRRDAGATRIGSADAGATGGDSKDGDSESGPCVRLVEAPDRRAEVGAAVRALVDLVQRPRDPMRYRDVAIVVRDLEPYHDLISASLRSHGIPFFIDRRRPTYHHPLIQCVRGALAMHAEGPFGQAMTMMLKSGLAGLDDEAADGLENYLLAHGLISAVAWDEEWTYAAPVAGAGGVESGAGRSALKALNRSRRQLRERIGEAWPAPSGKRGQPACRTWARRLCGLLGRLGAADRLATWCDEAEERGELDEAEEHRQVWTDLVKVLDELVEGLGDQRMTGRQFREVLESGLSQFTLGLVPATLDQVLVGSIERSRHPSVRAVLVLGFEDGRFPSWPREETIFGDEERRRLDACHAKLGRTRAQQLLDERMLAYVAVSRPSEFLWVSYPQSDEGKQVLPSPYWPALQAALPDVPVEMVGDGGPAAISTVGALAGGLASHMRAWCERGGDDLRNHDEDASAWLRLYEWAGSRDDLSKDLLWHRRPAGEDPPARRRCHKEDPPARRRCHKEDPPARRRCHNEDPPARRRCHNDGPVAAALAALGPPAEARLSAAATSALWPGPYRTSVTRLEQFAACPFQHYAARGLRLEPRAIHEISLLDMGSLYHAILEQFVNELMETGKRLPDLSTGDIAASLSRWCQLAVADHARQKRMEERERKKAYWRGGVELRAAVAGEQAGIGKTPLRPTMTERSFGGAEEGALPALLLETPGGKTVSVRGKIERVDLLPAGEVSLAVVLDYKRSLDRRLRLDEAYHGLALQLLAYLLVIRDHGALLTKTKLVPGGAFYLPLLGSYQRVDHPSDTDDELFSAYKGYKPRGVVDFDWIDRLDPTSQSGWSSVFAVYRKKDGTMGNVDKTDGVGGGVLPVMLDHVRGKMAELAEDWISGNIAVAPARLGDRLPCSYCRYRRVCRYEFAARQARPLARMSRSAVLEELAEQAGGEDG